MSKLKFELNGAGVSELMKSSNMQLVLKNHATAIKSRSGNGYEQDVHIGRNRANAMVWAESQAAKRDNSTNNTLLRAMR